MLENAEQGDHFPLCFRIHCLCNTGQQTHRRIIRFGQLPKFWGDSKQRFDTPHVFWGKTHHISQLILIGNTAVHSIFCLFEGFTMPVSTALTNFIQPLHFPNDRRLLEVIGINAPALTDIRFNQAAEDFIFVFKVPDDAGHCFQPQLQGGTSALPAADNGIVFGDNQRVHDAHLSNRRLKFVPFGAGNIVKKFLVARVLMQSSGIFQNDFLCHGVSSSN